MQREGDNLIFRYFIQYRGWDWVRAPKDEWSRTSSRVICLQTVNMWNIVVVGVIWQCVAIKMICRQPITYLWMYCSHFHLLLLWWRSPSSCCTHQETSCWLSDSTFQTLDTYSSKEENAMAGRTSLGAVNYSPGQSMVSRAVVENEEWKG